MGKFWRQMLAGLALLTRRDIAGIVFGALLLITILVTAIWAPSHLAQPNNGLGPEWDCQTIGGPGATTCIKRLPGK